MNYKQFLSIQQYDEYFAIEYNSPTVGITIKLENNYTDAEIVLNKLLNMTDSQLLDILKTWIPRGSIYLNNI